MPDAGLIGAAEKRHSHTKGIFSLAITVLLCLPSLVGGIAFLVNGFLHRDAAEWGQTSGALVAMGVVFGRPITALAAIVGATVCFRESVHPKIKYAHLVVVAFATIASLFFLFRFAM